MRGTRGTHLAGIDGVEGNGIIAVDHLRRCSVCNTARAHTHAQQHNTAQGQEGSVRAAARAGGQRASTPGPGAWRAQTWKPAHGSSDATHHARPLAPACGLLRHRLAKALLCNLKTQDLKASLFFFHTKGLSICSSKKK